MPDIDSSNSATGGQRPPAAATQSTKQIRQTAWLSAATLGLVACGGGGDTTAPSSNGVIGSASDGSGGAAPMRLPAPVPVAAIPAARLLAQAALGSSPADLAAVQEQGFSLWLEQQLVMPRSESHVAWLTARGYAASSNRNTQAGLDNTIWRKFISSPDLVRQRMVLALSELCVVSIQGIGAEWRPMAVAAYLDLLDRHALGNFRNLLQDISTSPAMGYYLTFRGNRKASASTGGQPDENYARELMQLFTIGLLRLQADGTPMLVGGQPVESYDAKDVSGLAKVFTGWDLNTAGLSAPFPADVVLRPMVQFPARHETGPKTFLGVTIPANTSGEDSLRIALDTLFQHPNLPPFVSRQLIQRLVTSNPSPPYVGRVAAAFANNGRGVRGDLQAVLRAILLDPEARDTAAANRPGFGKLREPVVRFLNWARAFKAGTSTDVWGVGDLSDAATRLGQSPMRSPSVFNFFRPGFTVPGAIANGETLQAPEFQVTTESSVAGYVNFMQRSITGGVGDVKADYSDWTARAADPATLLADLNLLLASGRLPADTLARMASALATIPAARAQGLLSRVQAAVTLVMASTEYLVQK